MVPEDVQLRAIRSNTRQVFPRVAIVIGVVDPAFPPRGPDQIVRKALVQNAIALRRVVVVVVKRLAGEGSVVQHSFVPAQLGAPLDSFLPFRFVPTVQIIYVTNGEEGLERAAADSVRRPGASGERAFAGLHVLEFVLTHRVVGLEGSDQRTEMIGPCSRSKAYYHQGRQNFDDNWCHGVCFSLWLSYWKR